MTAAHDDSISDYRIYRPDIDGLRAIAVLAVILFHGGIGVLSGGYTGVDVFFVISGYLIGGQIIGELQSSRFSFARFWFRRARRILPALLVMMLVTIAAGWLILMPNDLRDLGRSAIAQSVMASNIYFWLKADYFAAPSFLKPLLHTWTLSLEEQFYLLAPVVLLVLHRAGRGALASGLAVLFVVSLAASVMWTPGAPAAGFYLLPFRAWEFIAGVGLAAWTIRRQAQLSVAAATVTALAGLAMIVAGFVVFDESTSFPGFAALLPCVGTALVIAAGATPGNAVTRWISLAPMPLAGRMSYSLYLWHWPVFVYARYVSGNELPAGWLIACLVVTGILAAVSYRFVELPARRAQWPAPGRHVVAGCLAATLVAGLAGFIIDRGQGFSSRLTGDVRNAYDEAFATLKYPEPCDRPTALVGLPVCGTATGDRVPDVLVWGDSHSWAIAPSVVPLARERGLAYSRFQCLPVLGAYRSDQAASLENYACADFNQRMLEYIREAGVRRVLLVAAWSRLVEPRELRMEGAGQHDQLIAAPGWAGNPVEQARGVFAELVPATIAKLTAAGAEVWILKQVPQYKGWIANELAKSLSTGIPVATLARPLSEHQDRNKLVDHVFGAVAAANPNVHVIDPASVFCSEQTCRASDGRTALYFDFHHLSIAGAERLTPLLDPVFARPSSLPAAARLREP